MAIETYVTQEEKINLVKITNNTYIKYLQTILIKLLTDVAYYQYSVLFTDLTVR